MNSVHRLAKSYRDAGISVIPLRLDGSKAPALPSWQPYQERLATDDELHQWFRYPAGIGMVAGAISGGLEVLDFDDGTLFQPWRKLVPHIVDRLAPVSGDHTTWNKFRAWTALKFNGDYVAAITRALILHGAGDTANRRSGLRICPP